MLLLAAVLWLFIRYSIVSSIRTKGWHGRLQHPKVAELERELQVKIPQSLESYFHSDIVSRVELYLAAPGSVEPEWWFVARFVPLTTRDQNEQRKIAKVHGLIIACDGSAGQYYVPFEPMRHGGDLPVLLRSPNLKNMETVVAPRFEDFAAFLPKDVPIE